MSSESSELDTRGLGRLTAVAPREVWSNEAEDFTPWLAQHLGLLFDAVGLEVGDEDAVQVFTEVPVGPFNLDVLVILDDGRRVAIENQLEVSDHSHLGQLLLYGAGLDCSVLIWVATRFRDEYRAALDWMNAHTDDEVRAFGVELRVVHIGTSARAPVFDVIVAPNEWGEQTRHQVQANTQNRKRQEFFRQALQLLAERLRTFKVPKAQAQNWQDFRSGPFGHYSFVFAGDGQLCVEVYLDREDPPTLPKQLFDELAEQHKTVEEVVDGEVIWDRLPDRRASRVYVSRPAPDLDDPEQAGEAAAWAAARAAELIDGLDTMLRARAKSLRAELLTGQEPQEGS